MWTVGVIAQITLCREPRAIELAARALRFDQATGGLARKGAVVLLLQIGLEPLRGGGVIPQLIL